MLLDEIGDMPMFLQSKMLQVLQDLQFSRLGGKKDVQVDCWIMAATNQELEHSIREGSFREDLYYRLNIIRIFIPPLRERTDDVQPLINHFSEEFAETSYNARFDFAGEAMEFLHEYSWPGNVRELMQASSIVDNWAPNLGQLLRTIKNLENRESSLPSKK
jgi:two-component system response regulator AtoC